MVNRPPSPHRLLAWRAPFFPRKYSSLLAALPMEETRQRGAHRRALIEDLNPMNRNVGASFMLSVLMVSFFAVALYPRDGPPPPCSAKSSVVSSEAPGSAPPDPPPLPTPGVPLFEATEVAAAEPASKPDPVPEPRDQWRAETSPRPQPFTVRSLQDRSEIMAGTEESSPGPTGADLMTRPSPTTWPVRAQTVSRRRASVLLRHPPAFTTVGAGESLSDVAIRVYGSPESAEMLWRANRDVIEQRNSSLRAGMLLRTPSDRARPGGPPGVGVE